MAQDTLKSIPEGFVEEVPESDLKNIPEGFVEETIPEPLSPMHREMLDAVFSGDVEPAQMAPIPLQGFFHDDEETAARTAGAMYYRYTQGIPRDQAFTLIDEFNEMRFGRGIPAATAWGRIKQRYAAGKASTHASFLGAQVISDIISGKDPAAMDTKLAELAKIEGRIKEDWLKDERAWYERMLGATAEMLPVPIETAKAGGKGAAVGATLFAIGAAVLGQLGPQAGTLEETVTVPAAALKGAKVGATVAGTLKITEIESGGMMVELMKLRDGNGNKIDPKLAVVASLAVGAVNAGIELAQWKTFAATFGIGTDIFEGAAKKVSTKLLIDGTIKEILARKILEFGGTFSAEVVQEVVQETTNIVATEMAKEINNLAQGTDFTPVTTADIGERLWEITKESAKAFPALLLPGTVVSTVRDVAKKPKTVRDVAKQGPLVEAAEELEAEAEAEKAAESTAEPIAEGAAAEPAGGAVEGRYKPAGEIVDGRKVIEGPIPNTESISSSLNEWEEVPGIQEVPMSEFELTGRSYSKTENDRIAELADEIKASGEIAPLIVVEDNEGLYILEGGHRADALKRLGAKSFPALVVKDLESLTHPPTEKAAPPARPPKPPKQPKVEPLPPSRTKKTKLSRRIEATLKKDFPDSTVYETRNMEAEAARADKYVSENLSEAREVLAGRADPPRGMLRGSIYSAVKVHAIDTGDIDLQRELGTTIFPRIASEMGQDIKSLDRRVENDPIEAVHEVTREREKAYKRKTKAKTSQTQIKKDVKAAKQSIKKEATTADEWIQFLDELEC